MPANDPNYPLAAFRFSVEIGGLPVGAFAEVAGLTAQTDIIEYRNGNDVEATPRKIPGLTKYGSVTLKRGYIQNEELWNWRKAVMDGKIERRQVTIRLLDEEQSACVSWKVLRAWPAKWKGAELKATGNEIAIESLELANEGIVQESA